MKKIKSARIKGKKKNLQCNVKKLPHNDPCFWSRDCFSNNGYFSLIFPMERPGVWPEKSGFLMKMGNNVMGSFDWKKRWVSVNDEGILYYYKSKNDASPAGKLILRDCVAKSASQRPFTIGLTFQGRTYYFASDSKEEYESWFIHLDYGMVKKNFPENIDRVDPDDDVILSGWLNKMGNNTLKDWPKRWCVLKKEEMGYWRKQDDFAPAGIIKLATLHVYQGFERENCLELVTPSRTYFFHSDDMNTTISWAKALDTACRELRQHLNEDVLSALDNEDWHAKFVVLGAQKAGYLLKSGKNVLQQWPKRFVILRDDLLYYYKTPTDEKPLGVINLMLCTIKLSIQYKKFELVLPTRTYQFLTESSDEIDRLD